MYAAYYGLRAEPFRLSPDPAFYFDSAGHAKVLSDLRLAVQRAEGFVVVVGEPGLGKTLLLQALLAELPSERLHAVNLQALGEAESDMLTLIAQAFGIAAPGPRKPQLLLAIEQHLLQGVSQGRRSLLVIDEAQNLSVAALEELRLLSNLQLGTLGLLQVVLVGQSELARLLNASNMAQLRQRVAASCRLAPLQPSETRAYIEHRLGVAGWHKDPQFAAASLDAVHKACEGVPRRINQLCEQILQAASRQQLHLIEPELVAQVLEEAERVLPTPPTQASDANVGDGLDTVPSATWSDAAASNSALRTPLLCLASDAVQVLKARVLAQQLQAVGDGIDVAVVTTQPGHSLGLHDAQAHGLQPAGLELHLDIDPDARTARGMADALRRLDAMLDVLAPRAAVLLGQDHLTVACALLMHQRGLPVARLDAGMRSRAGHDAAGLHSALADRLATLLLAPDAATCRRLLDEGHVPATVHACGSLLIDVVAQAQRRANPLAALMREFPQARLGAHEASSYVLATLEVSEQDPWPADVADVLRSLAAQRAVLWLASPASQRCMAGSGFAQAMQRDGVVVLTGATALEQVALLRGASALLCCAQRGLADEAHLLGTPVLMLDPHAQGHTLSTISANAQVEDADEALAALKRLGTRAESAARKPEAGTATKASALLRAWLTQVPIAHR